MSGLTDALTWVADASPIGVANAIINKTSGGTIGWDPTPNANITKTAGGGIPFIEKGNYHKPTTSSQSSKPTENRDTGNINNGTVIDGAIVSGGGVSPAYNPAYSSYLSRVGDVANRAKTAYDNQVANINQQYNTTANEYNSQEAQNQADRDRSYVQNQQSLLNNRNAIRDQASQGLRGILSLLGAQNAGGSSAAQLVAPGAVADMASAQRAGANQTYGANQQSIDTNWNNYLNALSNERKKLNDYKTNSLNSLKADYGNLTDQLGDIRTGLQNQTDSASSLGNQLLSLSGSIPNAIRQVSSYTGNTPVYSPAAVSSYQVDQTAGPQYAGNADGAQYVSSTPFLDSILGRQKDDDKNKVAYY